MEMIRVFLNGFMTGLVLQVALGPVFFLVADTVLQGTVLEGFVAVAAVTIADYLYIFLAAAGAGAFLSSGRARTISGFAGGAILMAFGCSLMLSVLFPPLRNAQVITGSPDCRSSFIGAFMLTVSNPLTIVFWTGLFSSKALEQGYSRGSLALFSFSAGVATPVFLGAAVFLLSVLKASVPPSIIAYLRIPVGALLFGYGIARIAVHGRKSVSIPSGKRDD